MSTPFGDPTAETTESVTPELYDVDLSDIAVDEPSEDIAGDSLSEIGPEATSEAATPAYLLVRGSYRSVGTRVLELRVDVDGPRTLRKVSGDFFTSGGGTTSYAGSFVVHAPAVTWTATRVVITGQGRFTGTTSYPVVRVTIARRRVGQQQAPATVQFLRTSGQVGAAYTCAFRSPYFRTVQWEQDSVAGKVPFVSYDTGTLPGPPGSPARKLTVPRAYTEAGIDVLVSSAANILGDSAAGWNNAELHAAMQTNFSLWRNMPQWRVWLLVASRYEGNAGVRGIMFDAADTFQRQGCAVFYDIIKGTDPESVRAQLRTYVHELGHAFNLLHSWQKGLATPPAPLGPNNGFGDLSWMNYPQNFNPGNGAPTGTEAYWRAFPFQFTANEITHLRHGFYRDVIMGANAFGRGAADIDPDLFDQPVVDDSGLRLELRGKKHFGFGEPVVVELKLDTTDLRGRDTHEFLHPDYDLVNIAIRQPSGRTLLYRPLMRRCVEADATAHLTADGAPLYASAYVGYGQDGHYFEQPGTYLLRAAYIASDGSRIVSPVLRTTVRSPYNETDEQVGELMLGEEQGTLLALRGSDSPSLQAGNDALQEVVQHYDKHPLAVYARMVEGLNAERDFKYLAPDKSALNVRPAAPEQAVGLLSPVVEASLHGNGVDDITLNMVMRRLARAHAKEGNTEQANGVLDHLVSYAESKFRPHVVDTVRRQAEETRQSITAEPGA
ncbi:hypothetical protein AB0I66_02360 [Streptomyces sp. NPDC050439]|uniref:hypothetical protein n=1 Tax=unclassified Streptomyces TaxID=2593676 RepID=UPI00342A28CD